MKKIEVHTANQPAHGAIKIREEKFHAETGAGATSTRSNPAANDSGKRTYCRKELETEADDVKAGAKTDAGKNKLQPGNGI
jgi:hypothetical protein